MNTERYGQLSEDAQRLLCYYVEIGHEAERLVDDIIYLLRSEGFPLLDGTRALAELLETHILKGCETLWMARGRMYEVRTEDFVPALWYFHSERPDLVGAIGRMRPKREGTLSPVRRAVARLAAGGDGLDEEAGRIDKRQALYLCPVVASPAFRPLIDALHPDAFADLFAGLTNYLILRDEVVDTAPIVAAVTAYKSVTEAERCRIIADVELYDYIATGRAPENGIYTRISFGYALAAARYLYEGHLQKAVQWFDVALQTRFAETGSWGFFENPLVSYLLVAAARAAACESDEMPAAEKILRGFLGSVAVRAKEELGPALLLASDYDGSGLNVLKRRLQTLYDASVAGERPALFRHLAYLTARHLGLSANMRAAECQPQLALLQFEMSPYLDTDPARMERLRQLYGECTALSRIPHKAEWEFVLEDLMNEADGAAAKGTEDGAVRVMYVREFEDSDEVTPKEQRMLKSGRWSNGKRLNDTRFKRGELDYMTASDRRILDRMSRGGRWSLTLADVVDEMVDESRLYVGSGANLDLVRVDREQPYLIVERESGRFAVKSNVPLAKMDHNPVIAEHSRTHLSIISVPDDVRSYYVKLLQLRYLPLEAEGVLRDLLSKIGGRVEVHSPLIDGGSTLPTVEGRAHIGFQFTPRKGGNWEVAVFVRPLPGGRHTCKPGEGDDMIIDENEENGRVRVRRSLELERQNLDLAHAFWDDREYGYDEELYTPEFMLQLVELVRDNPERFYAEWAEGQSLRVRRMGGGAVSWSGVIRDRGQWFDIEGQVDIDEDTRVSIGQLLELVGKSVGNYVQIADGEFIALSENLKKQIKALDTLVNREKGVIKISPFSAALMGDDLLGSTIRFHGDKKLREIRQRILDGSTYTPEVPAELNAQLRPYQKDGYLWMARLNSWGAGALLADDMGLGKTIQTIAFLLLKKDEGPSLVVAPASVAPNWKTEIEKFAPTLNVQILNFAPNRQQVIREARAGDVIVTTYGILLSVQDDITEKQWNVACLDEAHIIKNRGAKTSAAAMRIQATNRVMLTGTPLQNHLGELWSLFQFVNPGLLGCYEHFQQKFILPIEGRRDKECQAMLDKIVHPFMLRRTKQAVLKELPDKTEIYQAVELNSEELAIYENIRIRAEQMLREGKGTVDFHVLAEIMRLRQAACSAQLIEPKWTGECSKITTLVELLQGVIEGGNRALVFSQFVSFFDIVRRKLDELEIPYFYIDGGVPVKRRAEMVNAFQKGQKAVFLISLKAGGLGLNLTGANYVFHLDPWWNPAIEQQATDRAYRIGQRQAVTVYHLVSKHTIEEKIIRLHQSKRELAESVLDGTDTSHNLTGKELLEMVRRD